ncbi:MAG: efflux RND transporter periplasmic adaptor subunit [Gallionella sp.]|nr:efflux RND transporter periplasmic adaptor subunit [Gallionella sp.]
MKKWIVFIMAALFPQALWAADIQATLQWSQRVELSTPVSGTVQAVNIEVGDQVKEGQVLLSLDSTAYRARVEASQSEITRLNADAEEDKRELDRVTELHERTVVSTTELDQARLKLVRSQSALSEAHARLQQNQKALDDASIRAPFDAVVVLRQAEPGQSVAAGLQPQMLLTLARSGEMIARMHLSLPQMSRLQTGQTLSVSVAGISYTGKIKMLGLEPVSTKEGPVYPVDVVFPSKGLLRAGAPAQMKLP